MAAIGLYLIVGVGVLAAGVFAIDPSFDLQVARYFTRPDVKDALGHGHFLLEALRWLNLQFTVLVLALMTGAAGLAILRPRAKAIVPLRVSLFVISVFALGPGLLVNGLLKEFWSRPRPRMLTEFGGVHQFMAWWNPMGTCAKNCSFVSGEASAAFAMLALAALAPAPVRYASIAAALVYGAAVSFIRVAVGAHFLSDVLFAGVFTALIVWVLHGVFWRWGGGAPSARAVSGFMMDRAGRAMPQPMAAAKTRVSRDAARARRLELSRPLAVTPVAGRVTTSQ